MRTLTAVMLVALVLATSCSGSSEPSTVNEADTGGVEVAAVPTVVDEETDSQTNVSPYSWETPDPFDATFGRGSDVLRVSALLSGIDLVPLNWQRFDFPTEDQDLSCAGVEPQAAVQTGWIAPPKEVTTAFPNLVIINIEQHGEAEAAERAADFLGSEMWATCQQAMLNQPATGGVRMSSDNPEGVEIASVIDRPMVEARRQTTRAELFGSEFELLADTYVWREGSVLYVVSTISSEGRTEELAMQAAGLLGGESPTFSVQQETQVDELVVGLRHSIERDPDQLPFFERRVQSSFQAGLGAESQDCATSTATDPLVVMNGPLWLTPTGESILIQGGYGFGTVDEAKVELGRYEEIAESCLVERAQILVGDSTVERVSVERIIIDGVEILFVDADMVQLASNALVPGDIDVVAQRTIAVFDSTMIGFDFVGIAGDEPDLLALTAQAITRMGEQ